MLSVPIPFVVAFLILLLLASHYRELTETATGRVFTWVLYLFAGALILIGIRWALDWVAVLPFAALLSVVATALLYLAYCSLGRSGNVLCWRRDWRHVVPFLVIALAALIHPPWVEIVLIAIKLIYATLLVVLALGAPQSLQLVRLGWLKNTQHALCYAVFMLLVSAAVDIAIAIDFALYDGIHAPGLVGSVNLMVLLVLGWLSVTAGRGRASDAIAEPACIGKSTDIKTLEVDDTALLNKLNSLLIEEGLYRDTELNLQKLARKASVPARAISRVINARTGQNMSQWVNSARIDAACDLLDNKNINVGDAMLQAGFSTKSNFNREFRRLKHCSPSQWKARKHKGL